MKKLGLFLALVAIVISSCSDDEPTSTPTTESKMTFQFKFDETQERLNGIGEPAVIPAGNAALNPDFNSMSAFYIELVPDKFTQIRDGAVIYEAKTQTAEANSNFTEAVIFDEAIVSDENVEFLELEIKNIPPGTYEYLRASVTFQNMDFRFNLINLPSPMPPNLNNQLGTIAGFIGFNSHITDLTVKNKSVSVNADKPQGFWAFEPQLDQPYQDLYIQHANPSGVVMGQSPSGGTTVVNPLAAFGIELPFGSCIVTGKLDEPLVITGDETEDIKITLSFSINKSFEWEDVNGNGEWDIDASGNVEEKLVDMGLRGLKVLVN